MKRTRGFTLIELLAVIVILAIIALISTPIIIGVIEKARKGAFVDSAYGVLDAGRIYFISTISEEKKFAGRVFDFRGDVDDLKLAGENPGGGTLAIDNSGRQALAIYDKNKTWCVYKDYTEEKVNIQDYKDGVCSGGNPEPTPTPSPSPSPSATPTPTPKPTPTPTPVPAQYLVDIGEKKQYVSYAGRDTTDYRILKKEGSGATGVVTLMTTRPIGSARGEGGSNMKKTLQNVQLLASAQINTTYASSVEAASVTTMTILSSSFSYCESEYSCSNSSRNYVGDDWLAGMSFWLSTPFDLNRSLAYMSSQRQNVSSDSSGAKGVMVVVKIKAGIKVTGGDGTSANPYKIAP